MVKGLKIRCMWASLGKLKKREVEQDFKFPISETWARSTIIYKMGPRGRSGKEAD